MQRRLVGSVVGVVSAVGGGAAMVPIRSDLSVSTVALVLVVPVVVGAAVGGFGAGCASVTAGFLVYDFAFIKPYGTLSVGRAQNWTPLVVYVVVMVLVARIVDALEVTRSEATHGQEVLRRVSEVSEQLVGSQPVDVLLETIVHSAQNLFKVPGVSLLVLEDGRLVVAACAGAPLREDELRQLDPQSGLPVRVGVAPDEGEVLRTIALTTAERPVGILAMRGSDIQNSERDALRTFANDAALALERAQLREQAVRARFLEEADRFRHGLMGAVSHDLRTPLATIKVASSTLSGRADALSSEDARELHHLIEVEADRLTRLVTNLLDMSRIDAGALSLHREVTTVERLIDDALAVMSTTLRDSQLSVSVAASLGPVNVDRVLTGQVMVNLLDNALRHAPLESVITVSGESREDRVVIAVTDRGPGVAPNDRATIFDRFTQFNTGGRAGLGLTIATTFVEAQGERLWYEEPSGGGASFVFSLTRANAGT